MRGSRAHRLVGVLLVGGLLVPGIASAKPEESPADRITHRVEHLKKDLSLTDSQAQQIRTILESSQASKTADRAAMQQRREQTDQQILAVLNDQQKAQYTKMQEERKKKWQEHQGEGRHHKDSHEQ